MEAKMGTRSRGRVVMSLEEAIGNIERYARAVEDHPELASRITQHPAWYAAKDRSGRWIFGPSKFIGYRGQDAPTYLAGYSRQDGKETEPTLRQWFEQVDLGSALGRELRQEFVRFAERFGKAPNARWRVSVARDQLAGRQRISYAAVSERIAFDPEICGGRPHIRGTRIRVSDIIAAMAEGETADELLQEFPYLSREDITAALQYAASSVDHRVLVAA
jgi:uncharacterized protein (DUF433 family)